MKLLKNLAIIFFDIIDKYYHQKKIISFIKKNNINVKYFLDIGSHIGTYSDFIIKNFKDSKILMFEPQKTIYKKIIKKYKNKRNIKIYNCAISEKSAYRTININQHDLTSSLSTLNTKNNRYLQLKEKLFSAPKTGMVLRKKKVITKKLSSIIKLNKIKEIDLAKIDTEGHELEVLKGAQASLKNIKYILIEFHHDKIYLSYNAKKIHSYLIKNNFILKDTYKFPFTTWEDRFYFNKRFK